MPLYHLYQQICSSERPGDFHGYFEWLSPLLGREVINNVLYYSHIWEYIFYPSPVKKSGHTLPLYILHECFTLIETY